MGRRRLDENGKGVNWRNDDETVSGLDGMKQEILLGCTSLLDNELPDDNVDTDDSSVMRSLWDFISFLPLFVFQLIR